MKPSYSQVKHVLVGKGYAFFTKPLSINIVGIRDTASVNEFNGLICVLWIDEQNRTHIEHFPATTKAGIHWLLAPMNKAGTAILIPGQYRGAYKIGKHNRSRPSRTYTALEQKEPMKYWRDNNKDKTHDYSGKVYEGNHKTNIHRSSTTWMSKFVDKWSAGCQVITGPENWARFLQLCRRSETRYGNSFTYTLLNDHDVA